MPKDAPPNGDAASEVVPKGPRRRVSEMQAKLHGWAAADPGRRFDDLFNLVCDPATLFVAFDRVAGNRGANTAGVDGMTVAEVDERIGARGFLDDLRAQLKSGSFRPLPVRQRMIPKPGGSGKLRKLGIPTISDRVVQAALKLVLEPIFETDFQPVSYGFRPKRRAHDAIADIQRLGTQGYRWVLDADIEACFDAIDHPALMDRVRARVKDKRVLALVKAFLKAGIMTETGQREHSDTGTPQGGILSPLLANIALSVLDEHVMAPWRPDGAMGTTYRRNHRRSKGMPTWRIVRYADDFVVLVHGQRSDVETLHEDLAEVLEPLGLRFSQAKTRILHMVEADPPAPAGAADRGGFDQRCSGARRASTPCRYSCSSIWPWANLSANIASQDLLTLERPSRVLAPRSAPPRSTAPASAARVTSSLSDARVARYRARPIG